MLDNRRPAQHNLEKERAIWAEKKISAGVIAQRLHAIGKTSRYHRMKDCADTIISDVCEKCEGRYVIRTYFCRDRLCPLCSWRRSRRLIQRLGEIIAINACTREGEAKKHSHSCEYRHPCGYRRYILLTLTVRNVPWSELSEQIKAIMEGWRRLDKRLKRAGSVTGWARALEVTRSKEHGDAHPHFHILMQTTPEYFHKDGDLHYHRKDELIKHWRDCLRAKYSPSISINAVKDTEHDIGRAVAEISKYMAKESDIEGLSDEDFRYYAEAVHGVHSWGTGGCMRINGGEIEEFLHNEQSERVGGVCRHCGGKLYEMREVWSPADKAYTVKSDMSYNNMKIQAHDGCVVNLNINVGGDVYVGDGNHGGNTGGGSG